MNEIRALTGLRGIAALIVFWGHTRDAFVSRGVNLEVPLVVDRLLLAGGRQVDIFFVLSGFILAMIYRRWFADGVPAGAYLRFLRKRIARVWPLHAAILLAVLATLVIGSRLGFEARHGADRFDLATLPQHLLLVHAWGLFMADEGNWNPPSWSVSIELAAYLLFPFLLWLSSRGARRPWAMIALAVAVGFGLNATVHWGLAGYGGLARGLSQFALGALLVYVVDGPLAAWLRGSAGSLCATAVLLVGFALLPDTGFIVAVLTAPLLLALCGDNPPARVLGSRPVFFLGEISYSIYLGHFLYTSISYRLIDFQWAASGWLPALLALLFVNALVIGLSVLTYRLIEEPARDWLSGVRRRVPAVA